MKNEEIIKALCTMFGAGFTGDVRALCGGPDVWVNVIEPISMQVITELDNNGDKYKDVYIDPRPFTDLLVEDSDGVCDAERIGKLWVEDDGKWDVQSGDNVSLMLTREDEARSNLTVFDDGHLGMSGPCNVWPVHKITAFLYENGYLIPEALRKGAGK